MQDNKNQIILTKRQASMILASMLIVALFVFITGYFLGKRTVIQDYSSQVTDRALHDQIDYLLTAQSVQSSQSDEHELEVASVIKKDDEEGLQQPTIEVKHADNNQTMESLSDRIEFKNSSVQQDQVNKKDLQYACLVGFATKSAAQAFVNRLKKHNIPVELKTITSKTASGKIKTWFQARTITYETAAQLHNIINKVKKIEHIRDNDIQIVHVK